MSVFTSEDRSDPIPVPFDPSHWIRVRKMTGREIDKAQEAHAGGVATGNMRGYSQMFKRLIERGTDTAANVKALLDDPLVGFDRYVLVNTSLIEWSYPKPVSAETIDDLEDELVEFAAREGLKRTRPKLFQTVEAAQEQAKNV